MSFELRAAGLALEGSRVTDSLLRNAPWLTSHHAIAVGNGFLAGN